MLEPLVSSTPARAPRLSATSLAQAQLPGIGDGRPGAFRKHAPGPDRAMFLLQQHGGAGRIIVEYGVGRQISFAPDGWCIARPRLKDGDQLRAPADRQGSVRRQRGQRIHQQAERSR